MYFTYLFAVLAAITAVIAVPTGDGFPPSFPGLAGRFNTTSFELGKRAGTPNSNGRHDGYYYSWWTDGGSQVTYTNLENGKYSVEWGGGGGNFVGGKGWNPGSAKTVQYSGQYNPSGNSYLAVYGWTQDPLVEYYIIENFGTYNPGSQARKKGQVQSDGGTYDIFTYTRINQPSINGPRTFPQYYSIRTEKRTGGEITTGNHFRAWEESGLKMGTHDFMIVAIEGYFSNGSATINIDSPP